MVFATPTRADEERDGAQPQEQPVEGALGRGPRHQGGRRLAHVHLASPVARVISTTNTSPLRFSIRTWPARQSPGFPAVALARQQRLRVGGRVVGLVAPPLASEVDLRVPAAASLAASSLFFGFRCPPRLGLGRRLFSEAHDSSSVPSTVKC
jgi:hypothetical protein